MQLLVAKPVVGRAVEQLDGRENDEEGDGKTVGRLGVDSSRCCCCPDLHLDSTHKHHRIYKRR